MGKIQIKTIDYQYISIIKTWCDNEVNDPINKVKWDDNISYLHINHIQNRTDVDDVSE